MWVYEYILVSMSYGSAGKGTKNAEYQSIILLTKESENSVWQVSCVAFMDMPRKGYTFIIVCILTYVKVTFFRNLLNRE